MLRKLARLAGVVVVGAGIGALFVQPLPFMSQSALAAKDAALQPDQLEQINKVSGFFNGFESLTGQFTQVGPRGNVSNGTFYISKPGKLRFEYNPPSPYLIVSDGTWVVIKNKKNKRTDHYPLSSTPLKLVLGHNVDLTREARVLNVAAGDGSIVLTLAAKNRSVPGQLQIVYNEERAAVEQWAIVDGEGRRTTISLSELKVGGEHDASLFKVKRPRTGRAKGDNR
ncbi:MAG: outer membrane lipoprotein carrier protein LolA [Pseudomonadota bacterium]